jgi:RNA polymerase sigma-70 factor (ECF subfamily)
MATAVGILRAETRPSASASADAETVQKSKTEPERFGVIFDRYFAEIHGYLARRLTKDIADDLAAETFLAAFRQRDRYDPERGDVRAWLYGIATNLIKRHRRVELRAYHAIERIGPQPSTASHEERSTERVAAQSLHRQLAGALARLNNGDRDVLMLVALAGLSYTEVAQALDIAYGTVCSRLNRARKHVRAALGGEDPTSEA